LTATVFEPPLNVGVAPTFSPEDDSIVTLCGSELELVKSIETLPAFALSDFVLYSSWPSGFASSFTLLLAPSEVVVVGAGVEVLAELVVGVSAAVLAEEEELDEELPQPASTSSAAGSASSENRAFERIKILHWSGSSVITTPPDKDPSRSSPPGAAAAVEHTPPLGLASLPAGGLLPFSAVNVEEAIRTRRTHKAYGPEPVPRAVLDELFELARWAPNHHVTNPWRFRVLGERTRDRLMGLAEQVQPGSAVKLRRAPTLVAVSAMRGEDPDEQREDLLASAVAAYIVLLGAHARGLAGYWRTVALLDDLRGRELLGIGADESPLGLLYLGMPVQEQRVPERAAPEQFVSYLD
jgi:nitroreductase